jgi:hypothetical protein
MVAYPIIAPQANDLLDPAWGQDVTDATNDHETQIGTLIAWIPVNATGTSGTTTSTSYTTTLSGGATPSTTFVARNTSHAIEISAMILNSGGSGPFTQYMSFQVTGSGFSTYGPSDADAATAQYTNNSIGSQCTRTTVVGGLTVGTTYTVTGWFKVSGSTGQFNLPRVLIH